jgi:hypothetical protein
MSFKQFVLPVACTILGLFIGSPNDPVSGDQKKPTAKVQDTERLLEQLIRVANDPEADNEERFTAFQRLGKLRTPKAMTFLLENVTLRVERQQRLSDDDRIKEMPAYYALSSMGEDAIPPVMEFLKRKRTQRELNMFALLLEEVSAQAEARKQLKEAEALQENLKFILPRIETPPKK